MPAPVSVFRTDNSGPSYHLHSRLRVGDTGQWPGSTGSQTREHLLQSCPPLGVTQEGNMARPHASGSQALRRPGGLTMRCHLHQGDWSFHLTNDEEEKAIKGVHKRSWNSERRNGQPESRQRYCFNESLPSCFPVFLLLHPLHRQQCPWP